MSGFLATRSYIKPKPDRAVEIAIETHEAAALQYLDPTSE